MFFLDMPFTRRFGCITVADELCFSSVAGFNSDVVADEDDIDGKSVDDVAAAAVALPAGAVLDQYSVEYGLIECVRRSRMPLISMLPLNVSISQKKRRYLSDIPS